MRHKDAQLKTQAVQRVLAVKRINKSKQETEDAWR